MPEEYKGLDKKKIAEMVILNKEESRQDLEKSGLAVDRDEYYSMYRGNPVMDKPFDWMSNDFVGITGSHVDSAQAVLMGMLFGVDPPVKVKAREPGDDRGAGVVEQLEKYHFTRSDIYLQMLDYVKTLGTYGSAVGKLYWRNEGQKRKIKKPKIVPRVTIKTPAVLMALNPNLPPRIPIGEKKEGWEYETKYVESYDDPFFENCPLQDCFPDPQVSDIQKSWFIHRMRKTRSYLLSQMESKDNPNGIYTKAVRDIPEDIGSAERRKGYEQQDAQTGKDNVPNVTRAKGAELIEILEWWGDYDINNDGILEPCVFTVAVVPGKKGKHPEGITIRNEENPFWHGKKPFVKSDFVRMANEFWGIGIPDKIYGSQHVINDTVNQRKDNVSFVMNRMLKVRKGAGFKADKLVNAPGQVHEGEELDGLEYEHTPDVTPSAYIEVPYWERIAQQESGITNITQGIVGPGTHKTLGGLEQQQAASGTRLALIAKQLEYTAIKEIAQFFYELDYQFLTKEKIIRIAGEKGQQFVKIKPEDVSKEYDFEPTGIFTMENRNEKALKLIQMLNLDKGMDFIKPNEIFRDIFILLGFEHPEKYIRTPEEIAQAKQQQMQMALAQKQAETQMNTQARTQEHAINKASDVMIEGEVAQTPGSPPPGPAVPPGQQTGIPSP